MRTRIYMISGLGADRRAFAKLKIAGDYEVVYLDWLPATPNESLKGYADRLAEGIDPGIPFYLIGLSFGGMLATEIAKKLKPLHTFLISSIPLSADLPWYYRLAGAARLQKMVPLNVIKNLNLAGLRLLGARTAEDKLMLSQLVADSDPKFIKWALNAILQWRNTERPENLTHIHGSADKILPAKYTKPDIIIPGGGHFMVYANADEVVKYIQRKITILV